MTPTKNIWIESEVDNETVKNLASDLNISQILSKILVARGINTFKSAQEFFRPHSNQFHDGFLMKGMEQAVSRIKKAVEKNENILVYGDYDVDGTCSVALIIRFLQKITTNIFHYQPHREKEGYGISLKSVKWCKSKNINLVIALDCGIKDVLASESMKKNSIDLIICDHHKPGEILPEAIAILNPKQQDCQYPFKELCGCGIGLKLIQSYNHKFNLNLNFEIFFQLAAVASAADVVPLIDENRLIVYLGLKALNDQPIEPLKLLFKNLKKEGEINIGDLIFKIAPRINAAGRMATAKIAANYLISDSESLLENLKTIESNNDERKKIDEKITNEALSQLEKQPLDRVTNLVYSKDWHKGVVGIVASRIIEKYYLPTIVLSEGENILTGSARSVKGFDIYSVLDNLKHLFVRFGGHKYAAGLSLRKENLELFQKAFEKEVKHQINMEDLSPKIHIDNELSLDLLFKNLNVNNTPKIFRIIKQMEPFGVGNPKPTFVFRNLLNHYPPKIVGESHLKFQFSDAKKDKFIDAIWFNSIENFEALKNAQYMEVVGTLDENVFRGNRKMQILIKDIKVT